MSHEINPEMYPMYHEIGHWMIATGLGYEGYITCNPDRRSGFTYVLTTAPQNNTQDKKNRILIAFGGLGAEKIIGIPLNAGHIGDLALACNHLKELYSLEGKIFQGKSYMDFPENEYDYYLNQSKIFLNRLGGKDIIIKNGIYLYEQMIKEP